MSTVQTFNASTLRKKAVFGIILAVFCGSALALQKAKLCAVTEMKWPWEDDFCGCTQKPVDVSPFRGIFGFHSGFRGHISHSR